MNPTATQMISGCGPGTGVPADTKQEGVRGERVDKVVIAKRIVDAHDEIRMLVWNDWLAKSRIYQRLADDYAALAKGENA